MNSPVLLQSRIVTTRTLYLSAFLWFLGILALVIWGINSWLGKKAPDSFEILTPYMLPVAALFTAAGFAVYSIRSGRLLIRRNISGKIELDLNVPGKELLQLGEPFRLEYYYENLPSHKGSVENLRYAFFTGSAGETQLIIKSMKRTFDHEFPAGYQPLNKAIIHGKMYYGPADKIRELFHP